MGGDALPENGKRINILAYFLNYRWRRRRMRGWLLTQILGCIVSCALSSALLAASGGSSPSTRPILQHVPDEPAQARAARMVREVYVRELTSKNPMKRRALAEKMILAAAESGDDAAARFVLLKESREVAAGAGDAFVARRAIALMSKSYAIDQTKMVLAAMNGAQSAAENAEALRGVVQVSLNTVEMAVGEDD